MLRGIVRNARRKLTRRDVDMILSRILTYDWHILTPREQFAARLAANLEGSYLAEAAHAARLVGSDLHDGACGDRKDFSRTVVRAAYDRRVLERLDRERWRHAELDDPRLLAYREGFVKRMRELEG